MSTQDRIEQALIDHHDWTYGIALNTMYCVARGCGWSERLVYNQPAATKFRAHQAEVLAGIVREACAAAVLANPALVVHTTGDMESYAVAYNDGYEAAVTQGLADDPSLADDWFQEKIREAQEQAWDEGSQARWDYQWSDDIEPLTNPYRTKGKGAN